MTNPKPRLTLDLDEFERQLEQARPQTPPARHDPLAELARIVGQDDPFRAILAEQGGHSPAPAASAAPEPRATARPDFAAELSAYRHDGTAESSHPADAYAEPSEIVYPDAPAIGARQVGRGRRSVKGLMTLGAVLGIGVLGVSGALLMRGGPTAQRADGPLLVQADQAPLKVQPPNPGGMDIPDQNKQIYERGVAEKPTRVVNREEQPVDVQQAARTLAAAPAGVPASATATPAAVPSAPPPTGALAALGEPKKVKTVAIRPDGSVMSDASPSRPEQMAARTAAASGSATPAAAPTPPARQKAAETRPAAPTPSAKATSPTQTGSTSDAGPLAADANRAAKPPQRVAAATPATASDASDTPATTASTGFAVQLGVRPSEAEARAEFKQLQEKFPSELSGRSPVIRKAQKDGNTIYRVRVGPMSKDDAAGLCTRLQKSGGKCYVANI